MLLRYTAVGSYGTASLAATMVMLQERTLGSLAPDLRMFVAQRALQGTDIPIHLQWRLDKIREVRVRIPPGFTIEEVNNATHEQHADVDVLRHEEPGYIGLVLAAPFVEEGEHIFDLHLQIEREDGSTDAFTRKIVVFRPVLALGNLPSKVRIQPGDPVVVQPRLPLHNIGAGTAVVQFVTPTDSPLQLQASTAMQEFRLGLKRELTVGIDKLSKRFPSHSTLLGRFIPLFFSEASSLDKKTLQILDDYLNDLLDAMASDEAFERDLQETFAQAFMRNLQLSTIAGEFVEFMKSVGSNKLIVVNPLDTLQLKKGNNAVSLLIRVTDRSTNTYPSLAVNNLQVISEKDQSLAVYKLFALDGAV